MYQRHKYFIFDLDGTLAYTIEDLRTAMNKMLRFFGWREISTEETLKNINRGARSFVQGSLPRELQDDEAILDKAYEKYTEFYSEGYPLETHLYPFVKEGIEYLKKNGAKLAVFSNKQDLHTKAICDALFPKGTFDVVMGHSGEFPHKPSPEGVLYIVSQLGGDLDKTVLVGDSDVDMKTAKNAGIHPVGVSWGYRPKELLQELGAEMIIHDLSDFEKLI